MIELTPDQAHAAEQSRDALPLVDPRTNTAYVLIHSIAWHRGVCRGADPRSGARTAYRPVWSKPRGGVQRDRWLDRRIGEGLRRHNHSRVTDCLNRV
jgi:hypothetical protein